MIQRNKVAFAASGAVLLTLVGGLTLATWGLVRERAAREQTRTEARRSENVARFLKDMLNGVEPSVALGRDTTMLREILDRTAERIGRDLKDEPLVAAELQTTIGQVYFVLGAYERAAAMHREALAVRSNLLGDEHMEVAHSLNGLGIALDYLEKFTEAESLLRKALALRRKLLSSDHPDVATSLHDVAHVLADQARFAQAQPLHLEALAMRKRLFGNEHLDVARSLTQLAYVLCKQGRFVEAEALYRKALAMRRKLVGDEHPEVCHSLFHLAGLLRDVSRLAEAEPLYRGALAIQQNQTPDHPGIGSTLVGLGRTLQGQGRLDEAESVLREAVQGQRKALGEGHGEMRLAVDTWLVVLQEQGKLAEAEPLLRERVKTLGSEHPRTAMAFHQLARVLHKQGKLAEAEENARVALDHLRKSAEKGDSLQLNNLAWYLATSPIPAIRDGRNAVSFAERAVAATSRSNLQYLDTLAAASAEAGEFGKAVKVQQEAIDLCEDAGVKNAFETRLKMYQSNTPYREP